MANTIEPTTDRIQTAQRGLDILAKYEALRPKQPDPGLTRLIDKSRRSLQTAVKGNPN